MPSRCIHINLASHYHTFIQTSRRQYNYLRLTMLELKETVVQEPGTYTTWHLPTSVRESSVRFLGGGTFGRVISAATDNCDFAIKKFTNPFQDTTYALRTYREICILRHLSQFNCPVIIAYHGTYTSQSDAASLRDLYVVTEKCSSDLRTVLQCNQLTESHIQLIGYRILCGLYFIHSTGIIHRCDMCSNINTSN